jgi:hypothetical protein
VIYTHRHSDLVSGGAEGGRVALVDNDTVLLDTSCSVTIENNVCHRCVSSVSLGLDAECLVVVDDLVVQDLDVLDSCISRD